MPSAHLAVWPDGQGQGTWTTPPPHPENDSYLKPI